MSELEQHLLAIIQDAFPLEERPYKALADLLHSDEQTVFDAVERLRNSGVIRRIGGIYDSKKLGFISRLCAGKIPVVATGALDNSALDEFVAVVNEIPAITHNYVRSHEYNVWFTVIGDSPETIQKIVDDLCSKTKLHDVHVLLATKKFKINTVMTRGPRSTVAATPVLTKDHSGCECIRNPYISGNACIEESDRSRIRIACTDIPHTLAPYTDWNVSIDELRKDIAQGYMRRFGAILRHQQAGFASNAMVCFGIGERKELCSKDLAGTILAKNPHVSHCYERPAFEGFPYTLYAMMHAQSTGDLDCFIKDAAESIGNPDYVVLYSEQELKKTSYRFFE